MPVESISTLMTQISFLARSNVSIRRATIANAPGLDAYFVCQNNSQDTGVARMHPVGSNWSSLMVQHLTPSTDYADVFYIYSSPSSAVTFSQGNPTSPFSQLSDISYLIRGQIVKRLN